MNVSDDRSEARQRLDEALAAQTSPRRPSSWLSESELRSRARKRNAIYLVVAAACLVLFVVLIHLLIERTRWSAGSSTQVDAHRPMR